MFRHGFRRYDRTSHNDMLDRLALPVEALRIVECQSVCVRTFKDSGWLGLPVPVRLHAVDDDEKYVHLISPFFTEATTDSILCQRFFVDFFLVLCHPLFMKTYTEGEMMKVLREKFQPCQGESQTQKAAKLGFSVGYIQSVLCGSKPITEALAEALGYHPLPVVYVKKGK